MRPKVTFSLRQPQLLAGTMCNKRAATASLACRRAFRFLHVSTAPADPSFQRPAHRHPVPFSCGRVRTKRVLWCASMTVAWQCTSRSSEKEPRSDLPGSHTVILPGEKGTPAHTHSPHTTHHHPRHPLLYFHARTRRPGNSRAELHLGLRVAMQRTMHTARRMALFFIELIVHTHSLSFYFHQPPTTAL